MRNLKHDTNEPTHETYRITNRENRLAVPSGEVGRDGVGSADANYYI